MGRILVVDDEEGVRSFLREALEAEGHELEAAADGAEAAARLEKRSFELLVTDLRMPGMDGLELLRRARAGIPEMEVIVLTAHGSVETAVEAMKLGAFDYLTKPLSGPAELRLLAARALEHGRLRARTQPLAGEDPAALGDDDQVAVDPAMRRVLDELRRVAPTSATVLLLGESGTGKEVAARLVHRLSPRRDAAFVAVNCAAVSSELVESEMFGHERGAFSGASERRRGRFELADAGTLFLDEIAELRPALQAKLLRVLQERSFERVGGSRTIHVDVRLIAATNRDLGAEIARGGFREDLYHRLAVFPVRLPPLRERPADVLPLAERLLARKARELGRPGLRLDEAARARLGAHAWPGNVRELGNVLERAAILATGDRISADDLLLLRPGATAPPLASASLSLKEIEREAIRQALAATDHHRKKAAERLGIGLRTLYDKLKEYGLE